MISRYVEELRNNCDAHAVRQTDGTWTPYLHRWAKLAPYWRGEPCADVHLAFDAARSADVELREAARLARSSR